MHTNSTKTSFLRRYRIALIGVILLTLSGGGIAATKAYLGKQFHYAFIITYQGEVVAEPNVLVTRGQTASCTIGDDEQSFTVIIHHDGTTSVEGPPGIELDVEIEMIELPDE